MILVYSANWCLSRALIWPVHLVQGRRWPVGAFGIGAHNLTSIHVYDIDNTLMSNIESAVFT
jgi:hypothetical protein